MTKVKNTKNHFLLTLKSIGQPDYDYQLAWSNKNNKILGKNIEHMNKL